MLLLLSCSGGNSHLSGVGKPIDLKHAKLLSLEQFDGYVRAEIKNPWDTTRLLHTYILVPDSAELPDNLPEGTLVRTPLKRAVVYSGVHHGLLHELGAIDAVCGVADASYVRDSIVLARLATGMVADCGPTASPSIERIMSLKPDAILLSPYENSGTYGRLGAMGIPVVECADYMEVSPLARAEWMKFYGLLFGCEEPAAEQFAITETRYNELRQKAATATHRPKVLLDGVYGGVWHQPAQHGTTGIYLRDAGAQIAVNAPVGTASVAMAPEKVLFEAEKADVWLYRYAQQNDKTLAELGRDNPLYSRFAPFKNKRVMGCNTAHKDYYELTPFHPDMLLYELICIFHPELQPAPPSQPFFTPLK